MCGNPRLIIVNTGPSQLLGEVNQAVDLALAVSSLDYVVTCGKRWRQVILIRTVFEGHVACNGGEPVSALGLDLTHSRRRPLVNSWFFIRHLLFFRNSLIGCISLSRLIIGYDFNVVKPAARKQQRPFHSRVGGALKLNDIHRSKSSGTVFLALCDGIQPDQKLCRHENLQKKPVLFLRHIIRALGIVNAGVAIESVAVRFSPKDLTETNAPLDMRQVNPDIGSAETFEEADNLVCQAVAIFFVDGNVARAHKMTKQIVVGLRRLVLF